MNKEIAPELTNKGWNLDWDLGRDRKNNCKNLWNTIRWRARDLYWEIRNFPQFIKRVWDYIPLLYSDRDYDYTSILNLLAYKCRRIREHIKKHGHLLHGDRVCDQLRFAELLIDRIIKSEYCDKEREDLDKEFGDLALLSRSIDEQGNKIISAKEILFTRSKCVSNPKLIEKEKKESRRLYEKAEKLKQYDYDFLFKHIRKHIQSWWD